MNMESYPPAITFTDFTDMASAHRMIPRGAVPVRKRGADMPWTVYILRCGDGTLYTGCTNDLPQRLKAHQSGRGAKYTRSRLPVTLAYREEAEDRSAALRREIAVKRLTRQEKLALIKAGNTPPLAIANT